jgi:hypothetical protein
MEHKRGDTFDYSVTIPPTYPDGYFAGWAVACQIRDPRTGTLVADIAASWVDPATTRDLRLLKVDTSEWPLALLETDVQFTSPMDGYRMSTTTAQVSIVRDVTT